MMVAGNRPAAQAGIGMIEVLVAMVIVAFAMLALIGAQASALRYQNSAHLRATASRFGEDLAERVRANLGGAHEGGYNLPQQAYPALDTLAPACFDPGHCTARELAAQDIHDWRSRLGRALTGGWGDISGSASRGFTVRVYFRDASVATGQFAETCLPSAADAASYKDVACFATAFLP
ncbi:type IV pilus modification protein PilV [Collimonas pratensis]|uniref:Type IV pilus modification protein PilV n=1 Tax=Collimonas pratensis TaxID=279113 RepID=A0A127QCL0_9BURK|nr:type IV pilus modification protein PilV [Collimonas pratensis]AMP07809.1 type IV pilus modification protein PilV [Collimonas pratensis]NKI70807.1 type IV pilus modification protein PilV [Collimonas pratensis]